MSDMIGRRGPLTTLFMRKKIQYCKFVKIMVIGEYIIHKTITPYDTLVSTGKHSIGVTFNYHWPITDQNNCFNLWGLMFNEFYSFYTTTKFLPEGWNRSCFFTVQFISVQGEGGGWIFGYSVDPYFSMLRT